MFKEFKKFILRGNVIDLAVGVVVGSAFSAIVSALVTDLITPFISALAMVPNFSGLSFMFSGSRFLYGHFIDSLISFILISGSVFFFIVKPINALTARANKNQTDSPTTKKCPECLSDIPVEAKRCSHCAQIVG
jgi:large conductance mechanosensitive channel